MPIKIAHDKNLMFLFACKPEHYSAACNTWNLLSTDQPVDHLSELDEIRGTVDSGYYWRVTSRDESIIFYVRGTHEVVINEINTFIGKCAGDRRGLNAGFNVITQEYTLNNDSYRHSLIARRIPLLG